MDKIKLFEITDGKSDLRDGAYREVVLERGGEVIDIVYNVGAFRAKHDMAHIREELNTYGYDRAKELAEYIKQEQANFEKQLRQDKEGSN